MADYRLSPEDHARVTAAVAEAERTTDAEIVTIVTAASDKYRDVALHYALAVAVIVGAASAAFPAWLEGFAGLFTGGWTTQTDLRLFVFLLLVTQVAAFLIVRFGLSPDALRVRVTPRATKERRVRRRAIQLFKASAEKRTATRIGVVLYLSLMEHRAQIVADEAIHSKVPQERWGDAMAALVERVRAGDTAGGMVAAVAAIGEIVGEHFPKTETDTNELPDRLIEL